MCGIEQIVYELFNVLKKDEFFNFKMILKYKKMCRIKLYYKKKYLWIIIIKFIFLIFKYFFLILIIIIHNNDKNWSL